MMDDTVDRLYQRVVEALQRTRRDAFTGPVTVAEIYQELVPYRVVRGEVGFDMNADYEHALLRLLAGEGDLARLEPAHARDQITKELRSPNPNVSIYRDYAGCDVWVTAPQAGRFDPAASLSDVLSDDDEPEAAPWDDLLLLETEEDDAEDALPFSLVEPEARQPQARTRESRPAERPAPKAAEPENTRPTRQDTPQESEQRSTFAESREEIDVTKPVRCAYCDSELPGHRPVRFCPYCGQDQAVQPCPTCGEPMEPGWKFCVSCGTARDVA